MRPAFFSAFFLGLMFFFSGFCSAGDFEDGMPIDEPVNDSIKLDNNTSFVSVKALSRARKKMDDAYSRIGDKSLNMGSVVVQPGADVKDITLIFNSENNIQISK